MPQLDFPIWAIQCVADFYRTKQALVATTVADLVTIGFFFLLSPGEYAITSSHSRDSTVQSQR